MKTPEKIKNELKNAKHVQCMEIASDNENGGTHYGVLVGYVLRDEIFAYIQQLESRLAQVERERDAAVKDISYFFPSTEVCKHYEYCQSVQDDPWHGCLGPVDCADYQYRGVCALNTKEV